MPTSQGAGDSHLPANPQASKPFQLTIPPHRMLSGREELVLARAAFARHPQNALLRHRLASQLLQLDHFDEALTLLEQNATSSAQDDRLLATALLNRERPDDAVRAILFCERSVQSATTPAERAESKTLLAKAHKRAGDPATSKQILLDVLAEFPRHKEAHRRLFRHYLETEQDLNAALRLAESSLAAGVVHARVLGAWVLALARLGRLKDARQAEGAAHFLRQTQPAPPPGWDTLEHFNAALTQEALTHPDIRFNRYGTASNQTWRLDDPVLQRTQAFQQLQRIVQQEVEAYVAALEVTGHPFLTAMPAYATLRNWCVITEGDGFETYHVHHNGWLSGVYYIHVQDHIAHGHGPEGCIAFGLPGFLVGQQSASAYGEQMVRPHSGLTLLFPSHLYHRTFPHRGEGRRICYAFDIVPADAPEADHGTSVLPT